MIFTRISWNETAYFKSLQPIIVLEKNVTQFDNVYELVTVVVKEVRL